MASNAQSEIAIHYRTTQIAWSSQVALLVGVFSTPFIVKFAGVPALRRRGRCRHCAHRPDPQGRAPGRGGGRPDGLTPARRRPSPTAARPDSGRRPTRGPDRVPRSGPAACLLPHGDRRGVRRPGAGPATGPGGTRRRPRVRNADRSRMPLGPADCGTHGHPSGPQPGHDGVAWHDRSQNPAPGRSAAITGTGLTGQPPSARPHPRTPARPASSPSASVRAERAGCRAWLRNCVGDEPTTRRNAVLKALSER